jgi:signal transduction histidine kinase
VEALARSVIERHQAEFYAAGIRLRLETKPDLPTIECDPLRVEQVFRNLILNAMQACKSGDRVNVEVEATGFAVKDTGEGIRPDLMINLFAPFFTTKASGTGLGLSTVRKIVDAHGWDIRVESSPAEGTAFRVFYRRATG